MPRKGDINFPVTNTAFSSSACKLNVHKRCHKNVANNCGVNSKEMADVLKGMGLTGNKLSESMRVKKVCILEHDEVTVGDELRKV